MNDHNESNQKSKFEKTGTVFEKTVLEEIISKLAKSRLVRNMVKDALIFAIPIINSIYGCMSYDYRQKGMSEEEAINAMHPALNVCYEKGQWQPIAAKALYYPTAPGIEIGFWLYDAFNKD